jgi:hypothetical protein
MQTLETLVGFVAALIFLGSLISMGFVGLMLYVVRRAEDENHSF